MVVFFGFKGKSLQFLNIFTTVSGLVYPSPTELVGSAHRESLQDALVDLIRSGNFFASLVMAMRTPENSIVSILVECELVKMVSILRNLAS